LKKQDEKPPHLFPGDSPASLIPNKIGIPKPSRESLQRKDFCIKTSE